MSIPKAPEGIHHGCPIVPALPSGSLAPNRGAEVLDQKPQASAVPNASTAMSKSRWGIKKIRVLFLTNERGTCQQQCVPEIKA